MAERAKTDAQKKYEASRAAYKKARDAAGDNPNATVKANVDKLKATADADALTMRKDNFKRVGNRRASNALKTLRGLPNVFNPRSYAFEQSHIDAFLPKFDAAVKDVRDRIESSLKVGAIAVVKDGEDLFSA